MATPSPRRTLAFAFLDRYASLLIGVVSSMVLARLLTPAEVGVFSVTMALLALVATVRDVGAGQYLLQEKELTRDRIRAVWAVQLGVGIALGALVAMASQPVATFYREPRIQQIMLVLALNYVVNPLGSVTYAWLMREMRYEAIAVVRFSAALTSAVVAVALATRDFGPMSLAIGSLCGTVANALVSVAFRPRDYPWMPGLREVRRVLSFGTRVTSSSILGTVAAGAPDYVLGRMQSLTAAGLYSRANGLVEMFNRLVTDAVYTVALSVFSKAAREQRPAASSFLVGVSYVVALAGSFGLLLVFLAHPAIRLLYGAQWDASADVVRALAVAMVFAAPVPLCNAVLIANGRAGAALRGAAMSAAVTVLGVIVGAPFGMVPAAIGVSAGACIGLAVWLRITLPVLDLQARDVWRCVRGSLVLAGAAGVAPALVYAGFGTRPPSPVLPLLLGGAGAVAGFLLAARWSRHPIADEITRLRVPLRRLAERLRFRTPT